MSEGTGSTGSTGITGRHVTVPVGYRVGGWEVDEPIASGAFGSVYAAHRTDPSAELPATAALKFLPTGTRTPRQLRHLRDLAHRELELHRRLRRPRLVRMYEALTVDDPERPALDGATVLVLERAEGSLDTVLSLIGLVAPGPLPGGPALLVQICEGLAQLHDAGWVHGDLKPGNVLLMAEDTTAGDAAPGGTVSGGTPSVRLADFNLAAEMDGTHAYAPAFSTPDYTPPELLWSEISERGRMIRPTADVWAFGVVAHLVLTGTLPLPGGTPSARRDAALGYARGTEELRLSPELLDAWRQIVSDCLARTHEERAGHTAGALLARAEAAADADPSARQRQRPQPPPRPRRLRARHLVLAATAALVVGAVAGFGSAGLRDVPGATGYHRCPENSACFFSEPDGKGEICHWKDAVEDASKGPGKCSWAESEPVRSVFNNANEMDPFHALAYYREPGHAFRAGCTTVHAQGNLSGTYRVLSHQWLTRC